jgi:NADH-quinone oxidoreductase subunit L
VTFIGATTAFFAATVGLVQNDIKRVIAYSTCSQLGYMFVALGVGAYSVGIFHLFTHAFFKALLFLGAGSVIHAMHPRAGHAQDGRAAKQIPLTYWMMVIGTLALTGFPLGTAGFFSKDAIIEGAFAGTRRGAGYAFVLLVIAALLTAFYSWRLIFMTFHGKPRASAEVMSHAHESPPVMLVPLYVLAVGALLAGMIFYGIFIGEGYEQEFWAGSSSNLPDNHILDDMHHVPFWVKAGAVRDDAARLRGRLPVLHPLARDIPKRLAAQHGLYRFLLNKWYFDELYDFLFVRPAKWLGRFLWKRGDGWLIDGFGPTASRRACSTSPRRRAAADRLPLPLRLRHADRRRALITWIMFGGVLMIDDWASSSPSPSCRWSARCSSCMVIRGDDVARGATSATSRSGRRSSPSCVAAHLGALRPANRRLPVRREVRLARRLRISYHMGVDGISMLFVILTTFLMPLCILASWEVDQSASRST